MAEPNFKANLNSDISRLSEFTFGLPPEASSRRQAGPQPNYRAEMKRPGKSSASDVVVSLVILAAAILGCLGMNSEMIVQHFPQLAVVLHLAPAPPVSATLAGADAHIKVWADLKTALYYCPGSAYYGQTRSGRFMSQADAHLANFEPAERRVCTIGAMTGQTRVARR